MLICQIENFNMPGTDKLPGRNGILGGGDHEADGVVTGDPHLRYAPATISRTNGISGQFICC